MFIARRWSAVGLCWYDFDAFSNDVRDLHLGLTEDDARLFLARRLRFARHRVLQRVRDDDVAHLDGLHGDAPRVRPLVDQLLQLLFDALASLAADRRAMCGR